MPEKCLYEYAVLRLAPRVEREEFLNVGVILYSRSPRYLCMRYSLPVERLRAFSLLIDLDEIEEYLRAFQNVCAGGKNGGPIGAMDHASRFRWLTAARSTPLHCSPVHPGLCIDPEKELERLFEKLVG